MVWDAVAFDEEITVIAAARDRLQVDERLKGPGDVSVGRPLGLGSGCEQEPRLRGGRWLRRALGDGIGMIVADIPKALAPFGQIDSRLAR